MNGLILRREWFKHWIYPLLFGLSLVVSLGAYLTLDSLQHGVNQYIEDNQKAMVGGDLILQSRRPFTSDVETYVTALDAENVVKDHQFNAMAYQGDESLLVRIKAIDGTYPLYGQLKLAGGQGLSETLQPGEVLVERQVLTALSVNPGDRITLGSASFIIADEIIEEPDRPLTAFGFGARVLMLNQDLPQTDLMGQRSRVNFRYELKVPDSELTSVEADLKGLIGENEIRLTTAANAQTSVSALSGNFLQFLKLLVVAVIVLSGVGLMGVVKAFVNRQQQTNAVRRALGEPIRQLQGSYLGLLLSMTVASVVLAWLVAMLVIYLGQGSFAAILPTEIELFVPWLSVSKVMLIALLLTLLMTSSTIRALADVKPHAVLHRHETVQTVRRTSKFWLLLAGLALLGLMSWELQSWWQGVQVGIGLLLLWVLFTLVSKLMLWLLRRAVDQGWVKHWLWRLSMQNMFRKGNQSTLFFTTMSMAVMVMLGLSSLNHTINEQLINTYPEDAPNMFMLDVQTDQHEDLEQIVTDPIRYYPVIRARIASVNDVPVDVLKDQLGNYDNITRIFNLSYGDELLATEYLKNSLSTDQLFVPTVTDGDRQVVPVSILDSIAEFLQVDLNDRIEFNIQGVPMLAQVSSIRSRFQRGPSPFFYFMFQPEVMAAAPQIQFATTQVQADQVAELQTAIAKKLPGITTLDGASIARQLKGFVDQLSQLVYVFMALSVVAGVMILFSSLVSTSQDRLQEGAFFRLMGMLKTDLYAVNVIELMVLGLVAYGVGSTLGIAVAYLITVTWFDLAFSFPWLQWVLPGLGLALVLFVTGMFYGRFVVNTKVNGLVRQLF